MIPVVEAVPNFSEGRDPRFADRVAALYERAGCEVLDRTRDPDHHRAVVTVIGSPGAVEEGSVASAGLALRSIDLRSHSGIHPRVGALDVLPFIPLHRIGMDETVALARRAAARIAALGVPAILYGAASVPPGRSLARIRRRSRAPEPDEADLPGLDAEGRPLHPLRHPTAGAVCVGARPVLLAWNVDLTGISLAEAKEIAGRIRERNGGFRGVRALGLHLPHQGRLQISMNLEDPRATHPLTVFRAIRAAVEALGGEVAGTEIIGMAPDPVATPAAVRELQIRQWSEERSLSRRLARYLVRHDEIRRRRYL